MSGAVEGVALLPCPFCNWPGKLMEKDGVAWVECIDCACEGPPEDSPADATEAWNTRTTPPARSYADGVEDAAKVAEDLANAAARLQATLELHGVDAPIKNAQRETATTLAAAIRLLSQGGKA